MDISDVKVGTVVKITGVKHHYSGDFQIGNTYTIEGMDEDGDYYFIDDAGDVNFAVGNCGGMAIYEVLNG